MTRAEKLKRLEKYCIVNDCSNCPLKKLKQKFHSWNCTLPEMLNDRNIVKFIKSL